MKRAESQLSVLSIGYTREMWDASGNNDTQNRLAHYASQLDQYWLITNSYRRHGLTPRRNGNVSLLPTNAYSPVDSFIRILAMARRIIRGNRVTVIQSQDPILTGLAGILLGRWYKVPVNVCVYGPNVFDPHWVRSQRSNKFLAPIGKWVLRRASSIQVDGQLTARRLAEALGPHIPIYIKPMIPSHFDRLLAIKPAPERDGPVVKLVFIGRLEAQKNLGMLADVFDAVNARLQGSSTRVVLELLGEGAERPVLEARLAKAIQAGQVVFRGQVPGSALTDTLAGAGMLVLTSFYEGYPRVLMEAAAAGLPIVSTAISGADEAIVDGVSGFITPIGDVAAFTEKVVVLAQDAALRRVQGEEARAHILKSLASAKGHADMQIEIWRSLERGSSTSEVKHG